MRIRIIRDVGGGAGVGFGRGEGRGSGSIGDDGKGVSLSLSLSKWVWGCECEFEMERMKGGGGIGMRMDLRSFGVGIEWLAGRVGVICEFCYDSFFVCSPAPLHGTLLEYTCFGSGEPRGQPDSAILIPQAD